jgi:hypothetical protein
LKNAHITRDGAATIETEQVNDGFVLTCGSPARRKVCESCASPCPANLIGVRVRVLGVYFQPALDAVASVFRMGAFLREIRVGHHVEEFARRQARRLKGKKRVGNRPVVVEPRRKLVLIIRLNGRAVFRDQQPQPDGRRHLAVGKVVHDVARAPFARSRPCVELLVGHTIEGRGHLTVAVLISGDERCPGRSIHAISRPT